MTTRILRYLVDLLSHALDPIEREAVQGDFAESNESAGRALREVLGLIARRQAELWRHWGPWLAPIALVAPAASIVGRPHLPGFIGWLGFQFRTLWLHGVRYETGLTPTDDIVKLVCGALLTIAWSWSAGFVLGALSRRAAWLYLTLILALWCAVIAIPSPLALFWLLPQMLLMLLPFVIGARTGLRARVPGLRSTLSLALAMAALTAIMQIEQDRQTLAQVLWRKGLEIGPQLPWKPKLLPFLALAWQLILMRSVGAGRKPKASL